MLSVVELRTYLKQTSKIYFRSFNQINDTKIRTEKYHRMSEKLRKAYGRNVDIVFRSFFVGGKTDMEALLIYQSGNVDKSHLHSDVLKPLMTMRHVEDLIAYEESYLTEYIYKTCIYASNVKVESDIDLLVEHVTDGKVLLLFKGFKNYLAINIAESPKREVQESDLEKRTRGNRSSFVENLWDNVAMTRDLIRTPSLVAEVMKLGRKTKTDVALIYLKDLVDSQVLEELKKRLSKIDTDAILDTGYIESYIEDNPYTPFPLIQGTERPDSAAANVLEGRILIMVNGSPHVLIVPSLFIQFFQTTEDYYEKMFVGTFSRLLRLAALLISITAPAAYIALTSYHPELVPADLLVSLARMRKNVPFPPFIEALAMEFVIEVLREAGMRLPTSVAQTLGVVGGIVLGEAAIRANLASPAMVLITTITAICTFAIPNYSMSLVVRLLRLLLIVLATVLGGFGIAVGLIFILVHLSKQNSMGIPYLAPAAPLRNNDMKDYVYLAHHWSMKNRPKSIPNKEKHRMKDIKKAGKENG